FFVEVLGAEELYRSRRGPDPSFMPANFDVPPDAALELAMLRLPPNLNVELFAWQSEDQRTQHPRHSDRGGHHLCFVVDDVDAAIAHLDTIPGVRVLGGRKEVGPDSPLVAGNRWTYFVTPWGLAPGGHRSRSALGAAADSADRPRARGGRCGRRALRREPLRHHDADRRRYGPAGQRGRLPLRPCPVRPDQLDLHPR